MFDALKLNAVVVAVALTLSGCLKVDGPFTATAECPKTECAPAAGGGVAAAVEAAAPVDEGTPKTGGHLRMIMPVEPPTLNNNTDGSDLYSVSIGRHIVQHLVDADPNTVDLKPQLAERWEFSPDKKVLTFYLRKGVKFHNGDPFTADDVVFTYKAVMEPKHNTTRYRGVMNELETVEKVDEHTVRFVWKKAASLSLSWAGYLHILPSKAYTAPGPDGVVPEFNTHPLNRAPIGTGPYKFVEWKTGDYIAIERDPNYWDASDPSYIDRITFKVITDDTTALQVFKRGDADLITMTAEQWHQEGERFKRDEKYKVVSFYRPSFNYIGWNTRKPPFDDARVRTAMTWATNREAIVETVLRGLARVIEYSQVTQPEFNDPFLPVRKYDPEKARALLAEAGWKDSDGDGLIDKDGKPFTFEFLATASNPALMQIVQILQNDLKQLGITMEIRTYEWGTFIDRVRKGNFEAFSAGWRLGSDFDPYDLFHSTSATGGANYTGFSHAETDALCERIRVEFDDAMVASLSRRLHGILYSQQPYTFLVQSQANAVVSKRLNGVRALPLNELTDTRKWWFAE